MRTIVLTVPAVDAELASDRLWVAGARAVEERTTRGDRVELLTSLGSDDDVALSRLGETPAEWSVEFVEIDERPAETWRNFARPIEVNERLTLHPAWLPATERPGALTILVEPGGAFGIGDHPTTRLSAAVVDEVVRPGDRVLDVGCGSGVLSVVATRRGATSVVAIDISELAREATVDNAILNGVADLIEASTTPVESVAGEFDLVVANILAPALVGIAPALRKLTAPTGRLAISGVLTGGYDHVIAALAPMVVVEERSLDGWSAVTLVHEQR